MKTIYIQNSDLTREKRFTYLASDVSSGGTVLIVQSGIGFQNLDTSSGQILCIGEIGNEKTEIIRTSTQYPVAGTSITLGAAGLGFDHPQDTKVTIIDWDRADIQWSATSTGTKSTIRAYPIYIQPDLREMLVQDTSKTSGYYFVRFNETIGNTASDWSDPIPFGGFDDNTVFAIKKLALDSAHEEIDGDLITHEFLNESLWEARREYHQSPGKRPFRRKYNFILGSSALTGSYRVELPTDVENPFSAENIYGVRVGSNPNMAYYDKKDWDFDYLNKNHSTLDLPYTNGVSTSIWLANGRDFSASANIVVEGMTIGLSRITGEQNSFKIITQGTPTYGTASAGSDAWENISLGLPDKFTVWADPAGSAYIYFNRPFSTSYTNENIYLDYYRTLVGYDSDADQLDEPNYDMFVNYLAWKIRARKAKGVSPVIRTHTGQAVIADVDYQLWQQKKAEQLSTEYLGVQIRMVPDVEYLNPTRYW